MKRAAKSIISLANVKVRRAMPASLLSRGTFRLTAMRDSMIRNLGHLSPRIKQRVTQQIFSKEATCRIQENAIHSFSSVFLYDTATRSKHGGRSYDMERIITRRKLGSGSLVLFLFCLVLSLASACSTRKFMSSMY